MSRLKKIAKKIGGKGQEPQEVGAFSVTIFVEGEQVGVSITTASGGQLSVARVYAALDAARKQLLETERQQALSQQGPPT